jgi:hypothetical protein
MPHDPNDPALLKWLYSLKPRTELAARYALRAKFMSLRCDDAFSARVTELLHILKPDDAELVAILQDAWRVGRALDGRRPAQGTRKQRQSSSS